jgi:hypothetical protein
MVKKCIESINNATKIEQKGNTLRLHVAYLSGFKKKVGRGIGSRVICRGFVTLFINTLFCYYSDLFYGGIYFTI